MIEYIFLTICLFLAARGVLRLRKQPLMPPGPPSDPILGHLRIIPAQDLDVFLYKLGKTFGGIVNLRLLRQNVLVLNSVEPAIDLLEKRSANYSGRPRFPFAEIMHIDDWELMQDYGDEFRVQRAVLQKQLMKANVQTKDYRASWRQHATVLAQSLGSGEGNWTDPMMFFSTSIVIELTYGHKIVSLDDPYLKVCQDVCNHGLPYFKPNGGSLVEVFPFLQHLPSWIPGNTHVRNAKNGRVFFERLRKHPYADVERKLAEGTAKPCFLTSLLTDLQNGTGGLTPRQVEALAAIISIGGAESTSSVLSIFTAAMILHPECQGRAQEEIDRVVGSDRLPDYDDRESLPYVESLYQEIFRWRPVVPLGIPHVSQEDDVYNVYLIPKKTTVVAHARGMSLDETIYEEASSFDPTRFLPAPEGRGEPHFPATFGFGRRICPGRHLADDAAWIAIVTMLATLTISRPRDELGNVYIPEIHFDTTVTCHPRPFSCCFEIRSKQAQKTLTQVQVN